MEHTFRFFSFVFGVHHYFISFALLVILNFLVPVVLLGPQVELGAELLYFLLYFLLSQICK